MRKGELPCIMVSCPLFLVGTDCFLSRVSVPFVWSLHALSHKNDTRNSYCNCIHTAERDNWKPSIQALQNAGASSSTALHRERHGALIEEARQLEQDQKQQQHASNKQELMKGAIQHPQDGSGGTRRAHRSPWFDVVEAVAGLEPEAVRHGGRGPVSATAAKARHARSHMNDGMSALNERGQKINQLSEKTGDLEYNASEYKDLAEQIRRKLEKQNKGLNFLNPFSR